MKNETHALHRRHVIAGGAMSLMASTLPRVAQAQGTDQKPTQAAALPNIVILTTGGTIAGSAASRTQTTGYDIGKVTVETLISAVPNLSDIAKVRGEPISNVGSDNMTFEILFKLAKRINELLATDSVDGVVVTHGTDTMEESAYFLNLVTPGDKPVVITGAMRPSTALSADGPMNLYEAVLVAGHPEARGRGVLQVMNDRIQAARQVTKTNTTALDTFQSPLTGPLGLIVGNEVIFKNKPDPKYNDRAIFDISTMTTLPRVDIIYSYLEDSPYVYDAMADHGVKGIVVAGTGAGSISKPCIEAAERAMKKGIVLVRSSRTGSGFVPEDSHYPGLLANSLNPAKARMLLMLALTRTNDPKEVQKYFNTL